MTRACRDCKHWKIQADVGTAHLCSVWNMPTLGDAVCDRWEPWDSAQPKLDDYYDCGPCDGYTIHACRALGIRPPDKCFDACPKTDWRADDEYKRKNFPKFFPPKGATDESC